MLVGHLERGIVDQHIDASEAGDGLIDHLAALGLVRQVARQQQTLAAGLLDPARGFPGVFVFVQVGNGHVRAFTGKRNRHGATNATVGTGDQGDLVRQPPGTGVTLFAAIGIRVHFPLGAGHRLALLRERWGRVVDHVVLQARCGCDGGWTAVFLAEFGWIIQPVDERCAGRFVEQ